MDHWNENLLSRLSCTLLNQYSFLSCITQNDWPLAAIQTQMITILFNNNIE